MTDRQINLRISQHVFKFLLDTVSDKNSWDTLTKRCFFPSRAPLVPLKVVHGGSVTKCCTPTLGGQGDPKVSQPFWLRLYSNVEWRTASSLLCHCSTGRKYIFVQCKALFSKWLSRRRRCNRDKIRVKLVKDWYSTFEDAESWRGVSGVRCKLQTLVSPQATNGWQFSTGEEGGWVFVTQLISQRCPSTLR